MVRRKQTDEVTEEDIRFLFRELIYRVDRLDLHEDDKLCLIGKLKIREAVELHRLEESNEVSSFA